MADESLIAEIKIALKNGLTLSEFGALTSYPNQKAVEKALLIVEKQGRGRMGTVIATYLNTLKNEARGKGLVKRGIQIAVGVLEQALKEGTK